MVEKTSMDTTNRFGDLRSRWNIGRSLDEWRPQFCQQPLVISPGAGV